ncbi:hypothetical protein NPX13_g4242 [Xylaria arbuscula]|uniref:NADPH--hemoprotein reductase n=1 Tax=Xylaria arbuscula TaxID=114810 RepID=A0A9W8NGV3_9PEZI|nr:hypothetical protein NPX13_g4242 [Xylaria arbuscula]
MLQLSLTSLLEQLDHPLLAPSKSDGLVLFVILSLWATHFFYSFGAYKVPDSFYHEVPQEKEQGALSSSPQTARNVATVFSERELDMVIFWGSQSGRAEMLAKRLAKTLRDGFNARVYAADLDDFDHEHLVELQEKHLCGFVLSTYGEGDPPDNANGLWKTLHEFQSRNMNLSRMRYVLFGLGNSEYRRYNEVAKHVDRLLQSLGAVRHGIVGDGDDANGMTEPSFVRWRNALEENLKADLGWQKGEFKYSPSFQIQENPSTGSDTVHLGEPYAVGQKIDLGSNRTLKYKTGDYLALWPINPDGMVSRILKALTLEEKAHTPIQITPVEALGEKLAVPSPTTYDALFRHYLEICAPISQELLADLASFTTSRESKDLLLRLSQDDVTFQSDVAARNLTVVDVLEMCGSKTTISVPVSFFLERFKPMQPRSYSISSSSIVSPSTIALTVAVNTALAENVQRDIVEQGCYGVATTYLHALERSINRNDTGNAVSEPSSVQGITGPRGLLENHKIFASLRTSDFKLPLSSSTPIIMIGAGTGIAPYRGFVQERVRRQGLGQEIGQTLLFMGFRHPNVDFVYKEKWTKCAKALGTDSFRMWTAFSRYNDKKVYVQDRVRENAKEILSLLSNPTGCRLYICGSAAMAREVVQVLSKARMAFNGDNEEQAAQWIRNLRSSKELLEDVWG